MARVSISHPRAAVLSCGRRAVLPPPAAAAIAARSCARACAPRVAHLRSDNLALVGESHEHVASEARRVIVARRLGVSERLEDGVGVENLLRQRVLALRVGAAPHEVVEQLTVGLGLAGARLARDHNALILSQLSHRRVRLCAQGTRACVGWPLLSGAAGKARRRAQESATLPAAHRRPLRSRARRVPALGAAPG